MITVVLRMIWPAADRAAASERADLWAAAEEAALSSNRSSAGVLARDGGCHPGAS